MPFTTAKQIAAENFSNAQLFLSYIASLETRLMLNPATVELKVMRAMALIQIYAGLERSVNDTVQQALRLVDSNNLSHSQLSAPFSAIALNSFFHSIKDSPHSKILEISCKAIKKLDIAESARIEPSIFSKELQNVWANTLTEITAYFGVTTFTLDWQEKTIINEVTDKRNAVAHGRDSPLEVGQRYNATDLRAKLEVVVLVVDRFMTAFEHGYANNFHLRIHNNA